MKTALIAIGVLVASLLCLPLLLVGGDGAVPPAPPLCPITGGRLAVALATIRTLESGGDYTARAAGSSASGAYQFIDTTWAGYGGYPEAWMAPPAAQDAKAAINVSAVLAGQHGDVSAVPVVWYIGHLPPPASPEWDEVPFPSAGNVLTPRQYQARWLTVYGRLAAAGAPSTGPGAPDTGCGSSPPVKTTTTVAGGDPAGK